MVRFLLHLLVGRVWEAVDVAGGAGVVENPEIELVSATSMEVVADVNDSEFCMMAWGVAVTGGGRVARFHGLT